MERNNLNWRLKVAQNKRVVEWVKVSSVGQCVVPLGVVAMTSFAGSEMSHETQRDLENVSRQSKYFVHP